MGTLPQAGFGRLKSGLGLNRLSANRTQARELSGCMAALKGSWDLVTGVIIKVTMLMITYSAN